MSHFVIRRLFVPAVAVCLALGSAWAVMAVPQPKAPLVSVQDVAQMRNGDLIFRRGLDLEAQAVSAADDDHRYTHVGLVLRDGDGPVYVLHIMPGEKDGDPGGVKVEPVQAFAGGDVAEAVGVYRLIGAPAGVARTAQLATNAAKAEAAGHPAFDWDFDLSDARKLYCTELVWRAYLAAGFNLAPHPKMVSWPMRGSRPYILPATLTGDGMLAPVLQHDQPMKG